MDHDYIFPLNWFIHTKGCNSGLPDTSAIVCANTPSSSLLVLLQCSLEHPLSQTTMKAGLFFRLAKFVANNQQMCLVKCNFSQESQSSQTALVAKQLSYSCNSFSKS